MVEIDLNFLAQQVDRLLANNARQRDDIAVLTAMVMRIDGTLNAVLNELRAMHTQIARMNDRIEKLEAVVRP